MKIMNSSLEALIRGEVPMEIASRLGVTAGSATDFINGKVNPSMGMAFGMPASMLKDVRNYISKECAIGMVIGLFLSKENV